MHVAPGTLRVKVLESSTSQDKPSAVDTPKAADLAWQYDLVITSFQRLSNEVRDGRAAKNSPLMEVHA